MKRKSPSKYQISEMNRFNKLYSSKKCLVPEYLRRDCYGGIIKAHTISKRFLKSIAEDGHVLGIPKQPLNYKGPLGEFKKIGVMNASIFTGFCRYHDQKIFLEIEGKSEIKFTNKQCALLSYRSVAMLVYQKDNHENLFKNNDKLNKLLNSINLFRKLNMEDMFIKLKLGNEINIVFEVFNKNIFNDKFDFLNSMILKFNNIPTIMANFSFLPNNEYLPKVITINSISTLNGGAVIFSWLKSENSTFIFDFIHEIRNKSSHLITSYIIQFFFRYSENTYLKISWYEALSQEVKKFIEELKEYNFSGNVIKTGFKDIYIDDWSFDEVILIQ